MAYVLSSSRWKTWLDHVCGKVFGIAVFPLQLYIYMKGEVYISLFHLQDASIRFCFAPGISSLSLNPILIITIKQNVEINPSKHTQFSASHSMLHSQRYITVTNHTPRSHNFRMHSNSQRLLSIQWSPHALIRYIRFSSYSNSPSWKKGCFRVCRSPTCKHGATSIDARTYCNVDGNIGLLNLQFPPVPSSFSTETN